MRALIARVGLRWRLAAWVAGVLLAVLAVTFAVVYERTGAELRGEVDRDVTGDVTQLAQAVGALRSAPVRDLAAQIERYLGAQPFSATSSLLFAVVPGQGTVSNHPESVRDLPVDHDEPPVQQARENQLARALLTGATGMSTRRVADVGPARFDERIVVVHHLAVRVGAGEPLAIVGRAQRSILRAFAAAGALALLLALVASYLAGASVSLPLRRMARVAARIDDGDLRPRMRPPPAAAAEVHVLADSFNRMLDRLAAAFVAQREFIADASHELRTPLTVIAGQLEVLAAQDPPEPGEVRRVQRLVAAEVARTSRLVDDMLLLARAERGDFLHPRTFDLRPFVNELWSAATVAAPRRFELGEVPAATLTADPDRLAQALRNLIANAIEHTAGPHGLVAMDVEALDGGRVRFVIRDDGPGIAEGELERVFERFHRTDASRSRREGGAGLGLAIVRAIAEAHGGRARALPSRGAGAHLELELPGLRGLPSRARAHRTAPHSAQPGPAAQR
ncbi:MAG TPA: HAMP domain-containing sensor histidine kinase [Solirubrobacteraceae bacterium]|nr:HAMP domain-containing sensor histidine kinase [Solirubrobacteraceae bacterium]